MTSTIIRISRSEAGRCFVPVEPERSGDINSGAQIVGAAYTSEHVEHATLWDAGPVPTDLGGWAVPEAAPTS